MLKLDNTVFMAGNIAAALLLAGCNQSLNAIAPNSPPSALPSTPADPVSSDQLPPITTEQQTQTPSIANAPTTPEIQQETVVASTEQTPTSSAIKITREGMAGSWQVPTDGSSCRIILAFTKWSGGYRAATRKCASPEIQTVNAWDVKDQSVVLVNQSGNEVARLFGNSNGTYTGRTANGQPVSFTR